MKQHPLRKWFHWHRVLNGLFEIAQKGTRGLLGFLGLDGKGRHSIDRRPRRRTYQPTFDILEERQLLATRVWDGGGADNLFSTAENWSSDTAPVTGDIILFDATSSKDAIVDTGWTATDLEDVDIQSGYSGTITWNRDLTITDDFVQSGGVVAGSYGNDIIVSAGGSFTWEAGTQTGGGTTLIESGASLSITGSATRYLEGGRKLRNEGSGTWTGAGTIESTDDSGTMENVGDLELGGTGTLYVSAANASGNDAALTLANTGILTKTGAGTFTFDGAALENDDTVEVDAGKLVLDGGSSTGATITVASGAELETTASYNIGALDNEGTVTVTAGILTLSGEGEASGAFEVSSGAVLSFGANYTLASGSDVGGAGQVTVTTGEIEVSGTYDVALTVLSGGAFLLEENNTIAALHLVGGWVKGSGTLTVTEELEWSAGGGFDGAGRTVVGEEATLSIDTGSSNTLYLQSGYTLENEGEGVLAGNGYLTQNRYDITETTGIDEGSATLLNEGTLEITGAVSLNVTYGSPASLLFDNQGTVTKSGEGTVTFNNRVRLENDGAITVSAGTLRISGEGEASGSFAVDAEAILAFASNYTLLTGTEVTGAMTVESSDLTIEGTVTAEGLKLQGGWIKGTGTLNVTEVLLWTNGGFDSAGRTVVGETAELTIDTGTSGGGGTRTLYLQGGHTLENEGDGVLAGDGYLTQNRYDITETTGVDEGSATLLNEGSLEITGAVTLNVSYGSPASLVLDNQGTLTKSSGSTATLAGRARLDNVGTVHVTAGGLAVNGGGTAEGDFVVSSGAALSFGDDYTLDAGSDVGGAGQVNVTSGAVEVSGTYDVTLTVVTGGSVLFEANNSVAGLHIEGGWVKGTGTLTVTEELEWTGGGFDSAGRTVVGEEATLSIDTGTSGGGGIRTLYLQGGYSLENDGDGVLAGDGYLTQNRYDITETTGVDEGSATLLNEGTLEITGAVTFNVSYGSPASLLLDNQGLLVKSGESTATLSGRARLENDGTVDVTAGVLAVNGGGEASGDFVVSSGGVLSFGENFALATGSDVGGAGQVNVTSGAVEVSGIYDVDLTVVTGGSIAFEANNTVAGLHVEGGWVKGSSTLTITDELEWTSGGFDGAGRTVVADTATLSIDTGSSNTLYLQGGYTLENEGEGVLAGNGYLTQNRYDNTETTGVDEGSATLLNEGSLEITGAVSLNVTYGSPASLLFDNQGTVTKSGEGTVTFNNRARLENDGAITVSAGTLRVSGEGEASGSFAVDAEAVLAFASNYTLLTGTEVTGAMTVESNNLTIDGSVSAEGLHLTGGWVKGSGTLTVTEDLEWSNGGGFDSAGHTIVAEGATLSIDTGSYSNLFLNGDYTLENQGDGVILGTGYLRQDGYEKSSTLLNEGTLDIQSAVNFYVYYSGSGSVLLVDNQGTLIKSDEGTSTFYAAARLNNEGTVNVTGGSLVLSGKGEAVGDFVVSSGTALSFGDDYTLAAGSDVGGTGQVNVTGGVVAVSGTYDVALTEVVGGSIQFEANNTIAALHLEGGWVKGSATLTVTDELEWSSGGGFDGAGQTVISESATLSIDTGSGSNLFLNGDYTLENQGDGVILGTGYLRQDGYEKSSTLLNEGTLDIQSAVNFYVYYSSVSALLLDNQGTLTKSGEGTATFLSEARLENDGTVNVTGGTLRISGQGEASGSFAVDAEAVLAIASDFTLLTGTSVTGAITVESNNLTIEGSVTAEGLILQGGWVKGTGTLTVSEALEWTGGGFDGTGQTIVGEEATLTIDTGSYSNLFLNGDYTLENQGDGVILGTGYLRQDGYEKSSTLLNEGTLDIQSAVNFYVYYSGSGSVLLVDNQGTLIKSDDTTTNYYSGVVLDNYGTIDVQAGTFNLSGGYNLGLTSVAPDSEITYNTETYTQDVGESGPFAAQGGYTYEGSQQNWPWVQTLATFTDPDSSGVLSEFTATVNWGDGSDTEEVDIAFVGGVFVVTGSHLYETGGDSVFSVIISRDGVGDLLVHGNAHINAAPTPADDSYSTPEDTFLVGASVFANDSDGHGGAAGENNTPFVARLVEDPTHAASFRLRANGTFFYMPEADYSGEDTFTYRVVDATGAVSSVATVTITVEPDLMTASGEAVAAVAGASTGTVTVATFTDSDMALDEGDFTASINWGDGGEVTAGTVVDNQDGTYSVLGTHTYSDIGVHSIVVSIRDTENDLTETASAEATVVNPVTLTDPGDQSDAEGDVIDLELEAEDNGSLPLTFSALGLPPGLSINPVTGEITGTVAVNAASHGPYTVVVTATNGAYGASQTVDWDVASPLSLTDLGDQSDAELDGVSLQIVASGGTLSYSATGLPPGLAIDPDSGMISGTIAIGSSAFGPFSTTVTITDGTYSRSVTFDWDISSLVQVTDPGDQTSVEGESVSLQIEAEDALDGMLTYSATGLPDGLSIGWTTGLISGTVAIGSASEEPFAVTILVYNGTEQCSISIDWDVSSPIVVTDPGGQNTSEGSAVSLQINAVDLTAGTISFSAEGLPNGLSISSGGLITGVSPAGTALDGPFLSTITATNGTYSHSLTVSWNVNGAIALVAPVNQDNFEGDAVSLQVEATQSAGGSLSFTAVGLPSGLTINPVNGLISGSILAGAAANNIYATTVTVTDGNYSDSQTFLWSVSSPVTLESPDDQVGDEGDAVSLQITASTLGSGTLSFSADGLPDGLSINASTGLISGTTSAGGYYIVTAVASDGTYQDFRTFAWDVASPVSIDDLGDQSSTEGDEVSFQIEASTVGGGTLSYSATGLPDGLSINSTTGLISGEVDAGASDGGPFAVRVTAADGSHTAHLFFAWDVRSPVSVFGLGNQAGQVGDAVLLPVWAEDDHGGALTYSATGLPDGLDIDEDTGLISGTLTDDGAFTVTVTATDGTYSAEAAFEWAVSATGPVAVDVVADQTSIEGDTISLQVQVTYSGGGTVTYSADGLPYGLTIDEDTGLISGDVAPEAALDGPYIVTVTATDGTHRDSQMFLWTVTSPVTVDPITDQDSTEGETVSLQIDASDSLSGILTYTADVLPDGLVVNTNTGLISGIILPGASFSGSLVTAVTATNGTYSASRTFTWEVNNSVTFTPLDDLTNSEGDILSLQVQATNSNSGTLSFSAEGLPDGLVISTSGLITGTVSPGAAANGPFATTVTATDGTYTNSLTINWMIENPITITSVPDQFSREGDSISLQIEATDATSGTVTFAADGLPPGLTINETTGIISGTIAVGAAADGLYFATIIAENGTYGAYQIITWSVSSPVTLESPDDQVGDEGDVVSLHFTASTLGSGTLSFSADGLPDGLSVNASTGLISGTISAGGYYIVTIVASDGTYQDSRTFAWDVASPVSIDDLGDQSSTEGDEVSLQIEASAVGGGTLSYSATGLPDGLSINSTTGLISGEVDAGASDGGPFAVRVTAADGSHTAHLFFAWDVRSPVSVFGPDDQTSQVGDTVLLPVWAEDDHDGTLSYAATGLPDGLSIDVDTGLISGTLTDDGAFTVTVTATDGTYSAETTFEWAVAVTGPVAVDAVADQTSVEGDTVSLQVQVTYSGVGTVTYSADGLPNGLSIDEDTGLITGDLAPEAALDGPYIVTVTATDGTYRDSQMFLWTVTSPVTVDPITDQDSTVGDVISLQVEADNALSAALNYFADGLPPGLSIDASTGLISGTIDLTAPDGTYRIIVIVNDGTYGAIQTFGWDITNPVTIDEMDDQSGDEGDTVSLQVDVTYSLSGTLVYSATGLPDGLSIHSGTGLISGDITAGGSYLVSVTVTDGTYSDNQSFTWYVSSPIVFFGLDDQESNEGDTVSLQVEAFDTTHGTLSYSATGLPDGLSINSTTGLISGEVDAGTSASGPFAVRVTATDGDHTAHLFFAWDVRSPVSVFGPGDQAGQVGDAVLLPVWAEDDHDGTLSYSATGLPDGLDIDEDTGLISGTLTDDGAFTVTVTATDGTYSAEATFEWAVSATGPVAVDTVTDQSSVEGDTISLQVQVTYSGSDPLHYWAENLPEGLSIDPTTGLITGQITAGAALGGSLISSVTVHDGTDFDTQMFFWHVTSPVSVTNPGSQTATEGGSVSLQILASHTQSADLTYSAHGLPDGLTIHRGTGLISGTVRPGATQDGPFSATVTATDGIYRASQTFVWEVHSPITLTAVADQTKTEGDSVSLQIDAANANSTTLVFTADFLPDGLSISAGGLISGTVSPGAAVYGPFPSLIKATDGTYTQTLRIHWSVLNPVSISPLYNQVYLEGDTVSLQVVGTHAHSGTLIYSADVLPFGLTLDRQTGVISGTIATGTAMFGPFVTTITATDGTYGYSETFVWEVYRPLTLTDPGDQQSREGDVVSLQLAADDLTSGTLTYGVDKLPAGLSLDPSTGLITGIVAPGAAAGGPYYIRVSVTDGTYRDERTFVWAVANSVTVGNPGDQFNQAGDAVSLQVYATGAWRGADLVYSAVGLPDGLRIDPHTGLVTGTVLASAAVHGPYTTTVAVSDGTGASSQTFMWTMDYRTASVTIDYFPLELTEHIHHAPEPGMPNPLYPVLEGDQLEVRFSIKDGWLWIDFHATGKTQLVVPGAVIAKPLKLAPVEALQNGRKLNPNITQGKDSTLLIDLYGDGEYYHRIDYLAKVVQRDGQTLREHQFSTWRSILDRAKGRFVFTLVDRTQRWVVLPAKPPVTQSAPEAAEPYSLPTIYLLSEILNRFDIMHFDFDRVQFLDLSKVKSLEESADEAIWKDGPVVRQRIQELHQFLVTNGPVFKALDEMAKPGKYPPEEAKEVVAAVKKVQDLFQRALDDAILKASSNEGTYEPLVSVKAANKAFAELPATLVRLTITEKVLQRHIREMEKLREEYTERARLSENMLRKVQGQPDIPPGEYVKIKGREAEGLVGNDHLLLGEVKAIQQLFADGEVREALRRAARLEQIIAARGAAMHALLGYQQAVYLDRLLAYGSVNWVAPGVRGKVQWLRDQFDYVLLAFDKAWTEENETQKVEWEARGMKRRVALLNTNELDAIKTAFDERLKTQQVVNMLGESAVILVVSGMTAGAFGPLAGGILKAYRFSGPAVFVGEVGVEALSFTAVNQLAHLVLHGPPETNFFVELGWNLLTFGSMKGVMGGYNKLFQKWKSTTFFAGGQAATGMLSLHGIAEIRHLLEKGAWMNDEERLRAVIQNVALYGGMSAGRFLVKPIEQRLNSFLMSKLRGPYKARLAELQGEREALAEKLAKVKPGEKPEALDALNKEIEALWKKELDLLQHAHEQKVLGEREYGESLAPFLKQIAEMELHLAKLGVESPFRQNPIFRSVGPGQVEMAPGAETYLIEQNGGLGGRLTKATLPLGKGKSLEVVIQRGVDGTTTYYYPAGTVRPAAGWWTRFRQGLLGAEALGTGLSGEVGIWRVIQAALNASKPTTVKQVLANRPGVLDLVDALARELNKLPEGAGAADIDGAIGRALNTNPSAPERAWLGAAAARALAQGRRADTPVSRETIIEGGERLYEEQTRAIGEVEEILVREGKLSPDRAKALAPELAEKLGRQQVDDPRLLQAILKEAARLNNDLVNSDALLDTLKNLTGQRLPPNAPPGWLPGDPLVPRRKLGMPDPNKPERGSYGNTLSADGNNGTFTTTNSDVLDAAPRPGEARPTSVSVTYTQRNPDFAPFLWEIAGVRGYVRIRMDTTTRAASTRKGNDFKAADAKMAEALNNANIANFVEPGVRWEVEHVKTFRKDNGLSWHHHENLNTRTWETDMLLVKTVINDIFTHTGTRALVDQIFGLERSQ